VGPVRFVRRHRFGLLAAGGYGLGALWVYARLWVDPAHRLVGDGQDHQLFIWMFAHAARSVSHLSNPLFSTQLNVPDGVNTMVNTSVLGLGIPLAPVTLLFGPQVSFAIAALVSLAGTAAAWYYVFSRRLVSAKLAALLGGALCGFGPGMIAHAPGHLHIVAQFVLPFIVLYVTKLAEPGRALRNGVILGLLVTYQVFIGEEMLLLTALACVVLVGAYAALRLREARAALPAFLRAASVAVVVAAVLLAYPLWFQFFGPQRTHGLPFEASAFVSDAWSYLTYPGQSVAGDPVAAVKLAANYGEENAFFGWPLIIIALAGVVWLWRSLVVRVLALTGLIFTLLSFGNHIVIHGHDTGIPGPYLLLGRLPVFDMALPSRFSLVVLPVLGALVALTGDRVMAAARNEVVGWHLGRTGKAAIVVGWHLGRTGKAATGTIPTWLFAIGTAAIMLVPIIPVPLRGFSPEATPAFVTDGTWHRYVPDGRTLVPVPLPQSDAMTGMRWSAGTNLDMAIPRGFFVGPNGPDDRGDFLAPARPTSTLLHTVATTGQVPAITDTDRRNALADLRFWRAAVVVLTPVPYQARLRATLERLLGPAQTIDGAVVWDVRDEVG
jgi:hypothetical protein